ncbi:MAG TPA: DUF86 domain-containing protein [Candidatus Paceibacterota bacterium]
MARDQELFLEDIRDSIGYIEQYIQDLTFEEFRSKQAIIDAVVRRIEIIGEAANNISDDLQKQHPDIEWSAMVKMRNIIAHEYFGVNPKIVWATATQDIPRLKELLGKIKSEHE